jgi:hypothetical protein
MSFYCYTASFFLQKVTLEPVADASAESPILANDGMLEEVAAFQRALQTARAIFSTAQSPSMLKIALLNLPADKICAFFVLQKFPFSVDNWFQLLPIFFQEK